MIQYILVHLVVQCKARKRRERDKEQVMNHLKVEGLDQLETEDDILAAAVALTR